MQIVFPPEADPARRIAARIKKAGGEAWLIGGCVRDLCLKNVGRAAERAPLPEDYDVATNLTPDALLNIFRGANETGKSFGVVRVRQDEREVEVATFRRDGPYSDGRRPDFVEFTTLAEDVARRDFTINAMAADPETGMVHDTVGGLSDLAAGLVRAVGDPRKRFTEDKLRLIRAIRFAHRLNFTIEPSTWTALQELAPRITDVAWERISDELTRILRHAPSGRGVKRLDDAGLLAPILPEITRMKGVDQPAQFHPEGDVFTHTLMVLDELHPDPSPAVAWAALLHDVGKPDTFMITDRIRFHGHAELGERLCRVIGRRFRLPNAVIERIAVIIAEHQKFADIDRMRPGRLMNWAMQPHFVELLEVHRADCAGSHRDMSAYETALKTLEEIRRLSALPPHIVTGATLVAMGLTPGPEFKSLLISCYEAQLEGRITNEEEGRAVVRELAAAANVPVPPNSATVTEDIAP